MSFLNDLANLAHKVVNSDVNVAKGVARQINPLDRGASYGNPVSGNMGKSPLPPNIQPRSTQQQPQSPLSLFPGGNGFLYKNVAYEGKPQPLLGYGQGWSPAVSRALPISQQFAATQFPVQQQIKPIGY